MRMQVIDVGAGRLNNVITFPPDGAFIVDSRQAHHQGITC
jgi:hypothetical protein